MPSSRSNAAALPIAATDRLHFPSMEPVRLGMPELCLTGLSESWLLKACGHRHWLALARAHGQEELTFRNIAGERLYPAFTAITLQDARLDLAREDDVLSFELTLVRTGRTRYQSHIRVCSGGTDIAALCMESAFIRRETPGSNRGVSRCVVARPCRLLPSTPPPRVDFPDDLCASNEHPKISLTPSPCEDFNGAGFLYFAAFQALIDRAEWQWFGAILNTEHRQIRYSGNIEPGESIHATLLQSRQTDSGIAHLITLTRTTDDFEIARCYTQRAPYPNPRSS